MRFIERFGGVVILAMLLSCVVVVVAADRSPQWRSVRDTYAAAHPACEACRAKAKIHVHHVKPFSLWPESELDAANLISLCDRCHLLLGHLGDYRAHNPLVREDAARMLARVKARPYTREDVERYTTKFGVAP
jgi:5-methylcytosine-specific restriction endonuclease McrA